MAARPILLLYNIDAQRRVKLLPTAARLGIVCRYVYRCEYDLPIEKLTETVPQTQRSEPEQAFTDPMFVMVNFTGPLINTFLNALRAAKMIPIALKAVMTPTNASWDSEKLHSELLAEHIAMTEKRK